MVVMPQRVHLKGVGGGGVSPDDIRWQLLATQSSGDTSAARTLDDLVAHTPTRKVQL